MKCKRFAAALCLAALCLALCACGAPGASRSDTDAVYAALDRLYACTSLTTSQLTVREETLSAEGESFVYSGSTAMTLSMILEPEIRVLATTAMKIAYADNSTEQTAVSYIVPEGDSYVEYYQEGDTWYKVVANPEDGPLELSITESTTLYLTEGMSFRKAGTDKLEGGTAIRYECALKGELLVNLLESNGHLINIYEMSENQQQKIRENLAKDLKALTVRIWVNEANGYPVRFEMDMADTLIQLNASIAATLGKEPDSSWTVNKFSMSMDLRDFNSVPSIEPPAEAADAELYDPNAVG